MKTLDLSRELIGHTNAARCCIYLHNNDQGFFAATGGQDNAIILWKQVSSDANDIITKIIHHSCWITCLLALQNGGFVSGGYDGIIRIYSSDGDVLGELTGHSNGITSLAHGPNNTIISGSWDGSARVWDLSFQRLVSTIDGMENAITAIFLSNDIIVTTSTGMKDQSDCVTAYYVRLWRKGELIRRQQCHLSSIRCCCSYYLRSKL